MISRNVIEVDEYNIEYYESTGKGDPLFLFHGNSFSADGFMDILTSDFGKTQKLIAVSFPGHGGSSRLYTEEEDCSFRKLGKMAAKIVSKLNHRNYWLLGQSLGAHAIMEALEFFPGARGLILVSSPPISNETISMAFKNDPSGGALFKGTLTQCEVENFASCFLYKADSKARTQVEESIAKTDPKFRVALGNSIKSGELKDELDAIIKSKIPIAVLAGTNDQFLSNDFYNKLPMDAFWRKKVIWFDNCGHALNYEDPILFKKVIEEFIGSSK